MGKTYLIYCKILPFNLAEIQPVLQDEFVRGEEDVKSQILDRSKLGLPDDLPRLG